MQILLIRSYVRSFKFDFTNINFIGKKQRSALTHDFGSSASETSRTKVTKHSAWEKASVADT